MGELPDEPVLVSLVASSLSEQVARSEVEGVMAMAVLLVEGPERDMALDAAGGADLASLGVTRVGVLRDRTTVAIVLEGWAFDPAQAVMAARALGVEPEGVRVLRSVVEMAVSSSSADTGGVPFAPAETGG